MRKKVLPLLLALVLALTGCGGKPAAQSEALSAPVYIPRSLPCPLPLETVTWGGMLSLSEKALLSGAALNERMQLTAYYENDMCFQRESIQCAKATVLLLDKAKYPATGLFTVGDMSQVQYLVTDAEFPEREQQLLREHCVHFISAK